MRPVIVAVDFSNTSIHAIEYAIPIANKFGSDIILTWVDKPAPAESIYPDTSNETRNEAKKRFEEIIETSRKEMSPDLKMEYKLRKGKVYTEIEILAKSTNALLIISGTHGISGFDEFWIGSNTSRIVTYASCPVITVRYDYPVTGKIRTILAPIDSSAETLQKLPFIAEIAKLFGSDVHLLATHYSKLKSVQRIAEKYSQSAVQFFEKNKIRHYHENIIAEDITRGVINYANDIKADLIGIMTEQETPMNILLGPHAQMLVSQAPQPIISLHPQEHFCL
jgi:nucleotide-binding universal stress UspA family protein